MKKNLEETNWSKRVEIAEIICLYFRFAYVMLLMQKYLSFLSIEVA